MITYVYKSLQKTDHICRRCVIASNGPKFADPRTSDDRPLFKRSMTYNYIHVIYLHILCKNPKNKKVKCLLFCWISHNEYRLIYLYQPFNLQTLYNSKSTYMYSLARRALVLRLMQAYFLKAEIGFIIIVFKKYSTFIKIFNRNRISLCCSLGY